MKDVKNEVRLTSNVSRTFAVNISRAETTDAAVLTVISFAAKRHWHYPEDWLDLWRPALTITEGFVAEYEVWVAKIAGEAVGFYALGERGERVELEHLWVLPQQMGKGVGRALFAHAITRVRALGAGVLVIESDPNAVGFYERMGAVRVGERVTEYRDL